MHPPFLKRVRVEKDIQPLARRKHPLFTPFRVAALATARPQRRATFFKIVQ